MTLNEIAYSIWDKLRPNLSDDDDISIDEIKYEIHNQRALLLRNELNRLRTIDPEIQQTIVANLEIADRSTCPNITLNCTIIRTSSDIPNTIELHNSTGIIDVSPLDIISYPFSYITYQHARYAGNGKYSENSIFAFLYRNRIYLISKGNNHKTLKSIKVTGVFENPIELSSFCTPDNVTCYNDDMEYPLKRWMTNYIEGEIVKKFLTTIRLPVDNSNDAKSNPLPVNK